MKYDIAELQAHFRQGRNITELIRVQDVENEAALIVVDKGASAPRSVHHFISPISRKLLTRKTDCWYCADDGHAFPIVGGIPCFNAENAVLVSKLDKF